MGSLEAYVFNDFDAVKEAFVDQSDNFADRPYYAPADFLQTGIRKKLGNFTIHMAHI